MRKNWKVLLIQLGDPAALMHSLISARAIKQYYPDLELSLVYDKKHEALATSMGLFQNLYALSEENLLNEAHVAIWITPLLSTHWDLVVNQTFSEASSYLTSLTPSKFKLGYSRYKEGSIRWMDGWSQYVQAVIQKDIKQDIHWIDLLTTQLLTALQVYFEPAQDQAISNTQSSFFNTDPITESYEDRLAWKSRRWLLVDRSASEAAKSLEDLRFVAFHERDLATPKSLRHWIHQLKHTTWVMTADPFVASLASALQTKCIFLTKSTDRWLEFAPYGNYHWVIETDRISAEDLDSAVLKICSEWLPERVKLDFDAVYRSRIRTPDEGGGVSYISLRPVSWTIASREPMLTSLMARHWFCGWTPYPYVVLKDFRFDAQAMNTLRNELEVTETIQKILRQLTKLHHELLREVSPLKQPKIMSLRKKTRIESTLMDITKVEMMLTKMSHLSHGLKLYDQFYRLWAREQEAEHPAKLCETTLSRIQMLEEAAEIHLTMVHKALEMAKPGLVGPEQRATIIPLFRQSNPV